MGISNFDSWLFFRYWIGLLVDSIQALKFKGYIKSRWGKCFKV